VDLHTLVTQVRSGDVAAFTELIRRYQDLAFGYAFSVLRDFHLAQDVAQEAFIIAYYELAGLQDPQAFPGWLRGIVRHQCSRVLRKRRVAVVSLEQAGAVVAAGPGLEQQVERQDVRDRVLAAIGALPQEQREVTVLFYIKEYSQQQIAAFLGLPVTTVNNRLHAARKKLKRRMLPMVKDTFRDHTLPEDFATNIGKIVQVQGPLIDAQFPPDSLPPLLGTLTIADAGLTLGVAQHLGDGVVRGVAMNQAGGLAPGMQVVSTGSPAREPRPAETLAQVVALVGSAATPRPRPELLETGIKVIDLLCPYLLGGKVGIFGDIKSGKLTVIAELLYHLAGDEQGLALFAFAHAGDEVDTWAAHPPPASAGAVQAIYVPAGNPSDPAFVGSFAALDAVTYLNRDLGAMGIWPAVDPLASESRALDPAIVGQEHYDVAQGVRRMLRQAQELLASGGADFSEEQQRLIDRARKIRLFFSQPFFIAEEFTKRPGAKVSRAETIRAFGELLAGKHDDLPDEALLWCGTIDEAIEKARALRNP
jgi:RNA polymerase sigma factor (sigma-70 family)